MAKKQQIKKGRLTAAERAQLSEVNRLLKQARQERVLSESKPLLALNKAAKQHKNKRLSEKDYKTQVERIKRLLDFTSIDVLKEKKKQRKKREQQRKKREQQRRNLLPYEDKLNEVYEKIKYITPYISKQANEIKDLIEDIHAQKFKSKKEIESAKEKIEDYLENFEKHEKEIDRGMRNYARLWDLEEEDLYNPEIVAVIEELEELEDNQEWYEAVTDRIESIKEKLAEDEEDNENQEDGAGQSEEQPKRHYIGI